MRQVIVSTNILNDKQYEAVEDMHNGCILCGGVGSGKSRTAIYYFFKEHGGYFKDDTYIPMDNDNLPDLYIITTARKRDTHDWELELSPFLMGEGSSYEHKVVIDSWNNLHKYADVRGAFFILDEQRLVGNGAWVKSFYKIARWNKWILLSATPGDKWTDYIPVFVANGFYRNRTEFMHEHAVMKPWVKWQEIDHYINEGRLIRLRRKLLVDLDVDRHTVRHYMDVWVEYDPIIYKTLFRDRMNIWKNEPIANASELCYDLRKVVNSDPSRIKAALEIFEKCSRAIIFYNFDYELEILRAAYWGDGVEIAEWNGHKHQPVPETERWVYFVQYTAGCEGWNCITTNTIIFYSQNYSYRSLEQAYGRIDRLTTPYTDLYYYQLKSRASIDLAIARALKEKKQFNDSKFLRGKY